MTLKLIELFGGIGACSKALERLGIDYEIADYVEIDKYAVKSYNAIHGTNFEPQDITQWDKDIEVDLIMHGSPCQDFSLAGKQAGGDKDSGTRSSLMYETIRIVEKLKPKYVIWENVKNLLSKKHRHNFDAYLETMEQLGYTNYYQVLNAKDYGVPQNRERVFTISIRDDSCYLGDYDAFVDEEALNFEFPPKQELKLKLKDLLEDNVDEKYYLSEKMMNYMTGVNQKQSKFPRGERFNQNINRKNQDVANEITTNAGNRPTDNFIKIKNNTKKGYLEAYYGDGVYTNVSTKRGTVQKDMIQTLTTFQDKGVVVLKKNTENYIEWKEKGKLDVDCIAFKEDKVIGTIITTPKNKVIQNNLRIRKLTPKECWRLMGFDDNDFEKAKWYSKEETDKILGTQYPKNKSNKVFSEDGRLERMSNTQLYKQAGNSIVVNVLEAIFRRLLLNENN